MLDGARGPYGDGAGYMVEAFEEELGVVRGDGLGGHVECEIVNELFWMASLKACRCRPEDVRSVARFGRYQA